MRDDYDAFSSLGAEILVVTRHGREKMQEYWKKERLPFVGISDPEGRITARFAQQWKLFSLGRMPAQFLLDCQGRIALAHYGKSMADILPNDSVLQAVNSLKDKGKCTTKPALNAGARE